MAIANDLAEALEVPTRFERVMLRKLPDDPALLARLGELTRVTELKLDASPEELPAAIARLPALKDLCLGPGLERVEAGVKALEPRLESLGLMDLVSEAEVAGMDRLLRLLAPARQLRTIHLFGVWELPAALTKLAGPLRVWVEPKPGADVAAMLALLAKAKGLEELVLWQRKPARSARGFTLEGIGALKRLRKLALHGFTSLPDELGDLAKLVELDLGHNELGALPDGLRRLKKVERLKAEHAGLKALPAWIGEWTALRELELAYNPLRALPASLGQCGLTKLDASLCKRLGPPLPPGLEKVRVVRLLGTKLEAALQAAAPARPKPYQEDQALLRDEAGLLREQPTRLDVAGDDLRELPAAVARLTRLEEVRIRARRLDLAQAFTVLGRVPTLRRLSLHTEGPLPPELRALRRLEVLRLSGPLRRLPDALGELEALKQLDLGDTKIDALPEAIGRLEALEQLTLSEVGLRTLPAGLGRLERLVSLDLRRTRFSRPPAALAELQVRELSVGPNTPAWKPAALLALLAKNQTLHHLSLAASVPLGPEVAALQVRELNLLGRRPEEVPLEVGRCPRLERLKLTPGGSKEELARLLAALPGRWKKEAKRHSLTLARAK